MLSKTSDMNVVPVIELRYYKVVGIVSIMAL
jgi:hypothetical protein